MGDRIFGKRFQWPIFLAIMAMSISCAAQKNNSKSYYHEDLYQLRPKVEDVVDTVSNQNLVRKKGDVLASKNVNSRVDVVLDSINRFNASRKFIDGYTIQIYSGQNREEAMNTKKKMSTEIHDLNGELEYNQPKFRVRVGNYFSRLEAQ